MEDRSPSAPPHSHRLRRHILLQHSGRLSQQDVLSLVEGEMNTKDMGTRYKALEYLTVVVKSPFKGVYIQTRL